MCYTVTPAITQGTPQNTLGENNNQIRAHNSRESDLARKSPQLLGYGVIGIVTVTVNGEPKPGETTVKRDDKLQ
jgi:hypothetical protein